MISAWHLLWIIPLSAAMGVFYMALVAVNKRSPCTKCRDCVWFAPVESMPEAETLHNHLLNTLGDILPRRPGEVGVCRKVTFCKEKPVLTNEDGYCHRAEHK